uniref:Uncharacterized protein n=1 Tax=Aegilops tauschii subsp. strangulata TaxID=200361 RepID=A0A453SBC1_AEGTS
MRTYVPWVTTSAVAVQSRGLGFRCIACVLRRAFSAAASRFMNSLYMAEATEDRSLEIWLTMLLQRSWCCADRICPGGV